MKKETIKTLGTITGAFVGGAVLGVVFGKNSEKSDLRALKADNETLKEMIKTKNEKYDATYQVLAGRVHDLIMEDVFDHKALMLTTSAIAWLKVDNRDTCLERLEQLKSELKQHAKDFNTKRDTFWTHNVYGIVVRSKLYGEY